MILEKEELKNGIVIAKPVLVQSILWAGCGNPLQLMNGVLF
jgi:hypothetical protein